MVFPLFSGRFATSIAPYNAAPDEIPTKMPSDFAISFPNSKAASFKYTY